MTVGKTYLNTLNSNIMTRKKEIEVIYVKLQDDLIILSDRLEKGKMFGDETDRSSLLKYMKSKIEEMQSYIEEYKSL